jgi:hypothetical protein
MTARRRWYLEPETFVGVAALIVSITAVAVGLYGASLQRKHDRAEVWPHVEFLVTTSPEGATLAVENTGIGPAIIKSVVVTVDGQPQRNWNDVLHTLVNAAPEFTQHVTVHTVVDHAVRPGDTVIALQFPLKDLPPDFWKWIGRVGVTLCYGSVFDEHWTLSERALGGTGAIWEPARDCPAQVVGTDF